MITRYVTEKSVKEEERCYLEIDITKEEMEDIIKGTYPDSQVLVHKVDSEGKIVPDSGIFITVSVGLLV